MRFLVIKIINNRILIWSSKKRFILLRDNVDLILASANCNLSILSLTREIYIYIYKHTQGRRFNRNYKSSVFSSRSPGTGYKNKKNAKIMSRPRFKREPVILFWFVTRKNPYFRLHRIFFVRLVYSYPLRIVCIFILISSCFFFQI